MDQSLKSPTAAVLARETQTWPALGVRVSSRTAKVGRRAGWLAAGFGLLVVVLGGTVQVGWFLHSPTLIQVLPELPPMTRNTSACFLLCGLAVLLSAGRAPRSCVVAAAAPAVVLSGLAIVQIAFRVNLGINEILGPSYINVGLTVRGGMAPLTAISFFISSTTLLFAPATLSFRSALLLGLNGSVVTAAGLAAVFSYWGGIALAALHTGAGFALLGFGMLALAWRADAAAVGAPRWLPLSVAVGVLAGVLGLWRALSVAGHPPFSLLPSVVLVVGFVVAPVFALTVFLAQRGYAQSVALRQSEALLSEAQRLSATGSFHWRVATDEVRWSAETYRIFGVPISSPASLGLIAERFHPDDRHLMDDMLARGRDGRDLEVEHRLRLPDGTVRHVHLVAHGTRGPDGRLDYIGAVQDVTERRTSEAALAEVRSELAHVTRVMSLGTLTASIAHEVNQPLAGIVTNAGTCLRMLAADPPDVAGAAETARRTIRDGNRAAEVIGRLRALFAKEGADMHSLDLNEAIREVVALASGDLQRHRVMLRLELDRTVPQITADRIQLQQVVLNLILNAADAMRSVDDRPRPIVVRTARDGSNVSLSVQDAGIGINEQAIEKIFDAFYTTKADGMGMGLSVSRSIVDRHGGKIWATPNDGPGVTFYVSLPYLPGGSATATDAVPKSAGLSNRN